jgi:hypothetical protein
MEERQCFSCHNQGIPILALTTARDRGFAVRSEDVRNQLEYIVEHVGRDLANTRKNKDQSVSANRAGSALATLEHGGWKADATTEGLVEYLLEYNKDLDHWAPIHDRPPSQGSHFGATYFALRGLRAWGMAAQKERIAKRTALVRGWLLKAKPQDTEDHVSRLHALHEVGVQGKVLQEALQTCCARSAATAAGVSSTT